MAPGRHLPLAQLQRPDGALPRERRARRRQGGAHHARRQGHSRRTTHARHGLLHQLHVAQHRRFRGHAHATDVLARGTARHHRTRRGEHHRHRRRRVRQADASLPRGRARPLEPVAAACHGELRRDVGGGDEARFVEAPRGDAVDGCVLIFGSPRYGQLGQFRRWRRQHRQVHTRRERHGDQGRRHEGRAGIRRDRDGGGQGPHTGRLLQGPSEVRRHLQGHRRRPLFDPGRLRHCRRRRHTRTARPRLGVHQHRRRKGVPGRSRRGTQDRPRRARRGGGWRARREVRSGHRRHGGTRARRLARRAGDHHARQGQAGVVQGAQARATGRHHRPRRQRQGRLQAAHQRGRSARPRATRDRQRRTHRRRTAGHTRRSWSPTAPC